MMQTTLFLLIAHTAVHDMSAYTSAQHEKTKKAVQAPPAPSALALLALLLPLPLPSLPCSIGFARIVLRVCVGAHTRSTHIPGKEAKRQRSKRQRGKEAK